MTSDELRGRNDDLADGELAAALIVASVVMGHPRWRHVRFAPKAEPIGIDIFAGLPLRRAADKQRQADRMLRSICARLVLN